MDKEKAIELVKSAFKVWKNEYDMTREDWSDAHEACDMAVKALTEESIPCLSEDGRLERCRFEYVNACKTLAHRTPDTRKKDIDDAYAIVRALNPVFGKESFDELPPAHPEPKERYWIPHETPDGDVQYECSRCGVLWEFNEGTPEDNEAYFCPKCGAYMRGEEKHE